MGSGYYDTFDKLPSWAKAFGHEHNLSAYTIYDALREFKTEAATTTHLLMVAKRKRQSLIKRYYDDDHPDLLPSLSPPLLCKEKEREKERRPEKTATHRRLT